MTGRLCEHVNTYFTDDQHQQRFIDQSSFREREAKVKRENIFPKIDISPFSRFNISRQSNVNNGHDFCSVIRANKSTRLIHESRVPGKTRRGQRNVVAEHVYHMWS